jgi:hypothetical protein
VYLFTADCFQNFCLQQLHQILCGWPSQGERDWSKL